MNDLIPGARVEGEVSLDGENVTDPDVASWSFDAGWHGLPTPESFPMSIYENVAYGRGDGTERSRKARELVETSLKRAALWTRSRTTFDASPAWLSPAASSNAVHCSRPATEPEVILMDEPASALDPVSTLRIEELMRELREAYTIVIVTHNMQQAARVSDVTAFFTMAEDRAGYLVEVGPTGQIFTRPNERLTEDYISGRFG